MHESSLLPDAPTAPDAPAAPDARCTQPLCALVVMGVSGCGKSTVGKALAENLGWRFVDGDDFHAVDAVARMRAGIALTDEYRAGWLDKLACLLAAPATPADGIVLACSALRRSYRDRLRAARPGLGFVYLRLTMQQSLARVANRPGHFFPPSLVADQFTTLEEPQAEPRVFTFDAGGVHTPGQIAAVAAADVSVAMTHACSFDRTHT